MAPALRASKPRPVQSPFVSTGIKKAKTRRRLSKKKPEKRQKVQKESLTLENGLLDLEVKSAVVSEL